MKNIARFLWFHFGNTGTERLSLNGNRRVKSEYAKSLSISSPISDGAISDCFDLNECEAWANACDPLELCVNTVGSYSCESCGEGFRRG